LINPEVHTLHLMYVLTFRIVLLRNMLYNNSLCVQLQCYMLYRNSLSDQINLMTCDSMDSRFLFVFFVLSICLLTGPGKSIPIALCDTVMCDRHTLHSLKWIFQDLWKTYCIRQNFWRFFLQCDDHCSVLIILVLKRWPHVCVMAQGDSRIDQTHFLLMHLLLLCQRAFLECSDCWWNNEYACFSVTLMSHISICNGCIDIWKSFCVSFDGNWANRNCW